MAVERTVASGFGYRPVARNGTCVAETECHYFKLDPSAKTPTKVALFLIDRFLYIYVQCLYVPIRLYVYVFVCTDIKLPLLSKPRMDFFLFYVFWLLFLFFIYTARTDTKTNLQV